MAVDATTTDQIKVLIPTAKQTVTDGTNITERDLSDLIMADKYLAAKKAGKNLSRGLRFTQLVPPGAG